MDQLPVGVGVFDADLKFQYVNEHLAAIHGLRIEQHPGMAVADIAPALADEVEAYLRRAWEGETVRKDVVGNLLGDRGEPRSWDATYFPIYESDLVVAVAVVASETTALKQAAQDIDEANFDITRQAYFLHGMAASIAHDLRSPIATARLKLQAMVSSSTDPELGGELKDTEMVLRSASSMIEGLLSLSKLKYIEHADVVDLTAIIKQAWRNLESIIERTGPATLHIPDDLPLVMGDDHLLLNMIQNLLENALKYRVPGKESRIAIGSVCRDRTVVLSIADNGIGISAEDKARLRRMFGKSSSSEGLGLGLAVVDRIVDLHRGEMVMEPSLEGGTSVRVSLRNANPDRIGKPIFRTRVHAEPE